MNRILYLPAKRPGRAWITYLGPHRQSGRTTLIDDAEFEIALAFWLCRCGHVLVYPADERAWNHRCPCCADPAPYSGVSFSGGVVRYAEAGENGQCL